MAAMSNYLESLILNFIFRQGSFTAPSTIAIGLCTGATNDSMTGATIPEVSNAGTGYSRQSLNPSTSNWSNAVSGNGTTTNSAALTFGPALLDWGTITNIAVLDSSTWGSGNVLFHGASTVTKTVSTDDDVVISISSLQIQMDT